MNEHTNDELTPGTKICFDVDGYSIRAVKSDIDKAVGIVVDGPPNPDGSHPVRMFTAAEIVAHNPNHGHLHTDASKGVWSNVMANITRGSFSVYNNVPHTGVSITTEFFNAVTKALNSKSGIFWLSDSSGASPYEGWDKALEAGIAHSQNPETPTLLMYGDRDNDVLIGLFHNGAMFIPGTLIKG